MSNKIFPSLADHHLYYISFPWHIISVMMICRPLLFISRPQCQCHHINSVITEPSQTLINLICALREIVRVQRAPNALWWLGQPFEMTRYLGSKEHSSCYTSSLKMINVIMALWNKEVHTVFADILLIYLLYITFSTFIWSSFVDVKKGCMGAQNVHRHLRISR